MTFLRCRWPSSSPEHRALNECIAMRYNSVGCPWVRGCVVRTYYIKTDITESMKQNVCVGVMLLCFTLETISHTTCARSIRFSKFHAICRTKISEKYSKNIVCAAHQTTNGSIVIIRSVDGASNSISSTRQHHTIARMPFGFIAKTLSSSRWDGKSLTTVSLKRNLLLFIHVVEHNRMLLSIGRPIDLVAVRHFCGEMIMISLCDDKEWKKRVKWMICRSNSIQSQLLSNG